MDNVNIKKSFWFAVVGLVVVVSLPVSPAGAASITIDNPGFEDPVLADGEDAYSMDNQGWGFFDVSNDGYLGSWNPGLPGTTYPGYGGNAPEGQNVGWTNPGGVGVPGGFAQVLTDADATLTVDTTYTLTVEVGNTLGWPWGGYNVQLLAGGTPHTPGTGGDYTGLVTGGTLLAEDKNTLTIAEDTFETSTVTYTYDPELHSGLLGEPLQIRLLSLGNVVADDDTEADFDNVRLTKDPASGGAECLVVDDFEEHPAGEMWKVWIDGAGDCDGNDSDSGSILYEESGISYGGAGSTKYAYDNDGTVEIHPCEGDPLIRPMYSRAVAQIADLPSGINPNWLADDIRALSLRFYGNADNDVEPMWVELGDAGENSATVTYGDNPGENIEDIKEPSWHEWNIDLQHFSDGGVNLTDVNTIAIGFGDVEATEPGGSGTMYFDDIRVCIRRCILAGRDPNFATVDYVSDCVVDYKEVELMAENWLDTTGEPVMLPIAVPNAGFEHRETYDPFPYGTDKYNQWGSEFWRHFEVDNNGGPLRIWKPGDPANPAHLTTQGIADVGFGGSASEGDYVVVVRSRYNDNEFHDPPQVRDFEAAVQMLADTFDPAKKYALTARVGRLPSGAAEGGSVNYTPAWFGYAVQLVVGGTEVDGASYQGRVEGGTVIAEDSNSLTVPINGFVTSTVVYNPDPANDHLAGQRLQIRLCALENPDDHSLTGWVAFDDVKLLGSSESTTVEPDLYPDLVINFKDFAVLADRFLDVDGMFPEI